MNNFILIIFSLFIVSSFCETTIQLNASPLLNLHYSFPSADTIQFTLEYHTLGYVAIGFGTSMTNSEIILAYFVNGVLTLHDTHSDHHGVPTELSDKNLVLIDGNRDNEKTVVTFTRKLNTGDANDFIIPVGKEIPLIWAYGATDELKHHAGRGQINVTFQNNQMVGFLNK